MRTCLKLAALFVSGLCVVGCGFGTFNNAPSTPSTIAVTPVPISVPAGTTVTFSAAVTGTTAAPQWLLLNGAYAPSESSLGSISSSTGDSITYTAPATPPIYTPFEGEILPGQVNIEALVPNGGTFTFATQVVSFVITTPSITAGIVPTTATVALGSTMEVNAYVVGATNNALTMEVNGVAGGAAATGTIGPSTVGFYGFYTYTAPTTMPMSGNTVTVTAVSVGDPTKTAALVITLQ